MASRHPRTIILPQLPDDLIDDIFERLPPKVITRCKLLSKGWYQKISSKQFILRHSKRMSLRNRVFTLLQPEHCFIPLQYFVNFEGQRQNRRVIYQGMRETEYIASCGNLALVATSEDEFFMVNPITNYRFSLPEELISFPPRTNSASVVFALGYNQSQEYFQVVRLSLFHSEDWNTKMRVYSKSTNNWKNFGEFPFSRDVPSPGIYANSSVHWMFYSPHIVVFNLVEETFRLINLPLEVNRNYRHYSFTALNTDKIIVFPSMYMADEPVVIWKLDDYSEANSWTQYSINLDLPIRNVRVINFQPLFLVEPSRNEIVIRINPIGTFWCWDLEGHRFSPMLGEEIVNEASSAFPIVEGLS